LAVAAAAAVLWPFMLPAEQRAWSAVSTFALLLAGWALVSAGLHAWQRLHEGAGDWRSRARRQPRGWWGMLLAHAGIGVFIFGATMANGFEKRQELKLNLGEQVALAGFEFRFEGIAPASGPNYDAQRATVQVTHKGQVVATLHPEKRIYRAQQMPLSQAAIDVGLTRDLFVALGEPARDAAWTMRLHVKPFMAWIWAGCLLMALGGLLALSDRRYRLAARREADATSGATARL